MTIRFAEFELDEDCREIRLRGREIAVQPRVLDLLLYLVRNRDRVVSKDELLEALWPGTVVVDGAVQRVVSLARSVLQQGGARDAIRTYARHGYRFCLEPASSIQSEEPVAAASDELRSARDAYEKGDWAAAVVAYQAADVASPLAAADLERWAQAAHWAGDARRAVEPLERAVAAHLSQGDRRGAARASLLLAQIAFERLELAVAAGWLKRASRFLMSLEVSREHGLMHYLTARMKLFEGAHESAFQAAEAARRIGVNLEDPDLEGLGLVYGGHALLSQGEVLKGVEYQNEAAVTVLSDETSAWAGALIYCSLIWTCRNLADWQRAAQWTEQFTRWCERRGMGAFPGTCRLHRAEVLTVRGDLEEAVRELDETTGVLATWAPWAEGDAYRVLGDLRLGQGNLEAAGAAYQRARELGWDPQPGYSTLLLTQGEPEAAVRSLEASLADRGWVNQERRGSLLAHLGIAAARSGDPNRARSVLEALEANPELWSTPAVEAVVAQSRAELEWAEQRHADAVVAQRAAISLWQKAGSPLNMAHLRLRLAQWLLETDDNAAAGLELALAVTAFDRHGAAGPAERCRALQAALLEQPG